MIATITINPAIDKSTVVEKLIPEKKLSYQLSGMLLFIKILFRKKIAKDNYSLLTNIYHAD